jgi:hypothetical protein
MLTGKTGTAATVRLDGKVTPVEVSAGSADAQIATPSLSEHATPRPAGGITVPLRRLAYGRSGDKGDGANIGLMARRPEFAEVIRQQVTADRVRSLFAHYEPGEIRRWELPGIHAMNIVIDNVLGGQGGTSTLRYDPQGKSYAAMLLTLPITVPSSWDHDGRLTAGGTPDVFAAEPSAEASRGALLTNR